MSDFVVDQKDPKPQLGSAPGPRRHETLRSYFLDETGPGHDSSISNLQTTERSVPSQRIHGSLAGARTELRAYSRCRWASVARAYENGVGGCRGKSTVNTQPVP